MKRLAFVFLLVTSPALGQSYIGPASIKQPTVAGHCVEVGPEGQNVVVDSGEPCGGGATEGPVGPPGPVGPQGPPGESAASPPGGAGVVQSDANGNLISSQIIPTPLTLNGFPITIGDASLANPGATEVDADSHKCPSTAGICTIVMWMEVRDAAGTRYFIPMFNAPNPPIKDAP